MDGQTDAEQADPYVPLCFAGDTKIITHPFQFIWTFGRDEAATMNMYI